MLNLSNSTLRILSHRACLHGPDAARENTYPALRRAAAAGFDVEFDIQFEPQNTRLVLTHDPCPWSEERDALRFLASVGGSQFHALNVKSLDSLPSVLQQLTDTGTTDNFFLFDFELVSSDLAACRSLMRSLTEKGFHVAYRLSEREAFLEQYLKDPSVSFVWLDEFTARWVTREHLDRLTERSIQTYYVSPDLHGVHDLDTLKQRWEQLVSWGADGICTDYPCALRRFLHEGSHS